MNATLDLRLAEAKYEAFEQHVHHAVVVRHRRHLLTVLVVGLLLGAAAGYLTGAVSAPAPEEVIVTLPLEHPDDSQLAGAVERVLVKLREGGTPRRGKLATHRQRLALDAGDDRAGSVGPHAHPTLSTGNSVMMTTRSSFR